MYNHDPIEAVRQDQNSEHRRKTISVKSGYGVKKPGKQKTFVPKGHDAILKRYQDNKTRVVLASVNSDCTYVGTIVARDRYTVTIKNDQGRPVVVYKHAIESFFPFDIPADTEAGE